MSGSDQVPPRHSLGYKINLVLRTVTPHGEQPPSDAEIARRMNARAVTMHAEGRLSEPLTFTKMWSWQLRHPRNGKWPDTLFANLCVFAEEFRVPIDLFTSGPSASAIEEQLERLNLMKQDERVVAIAHRMSNLPARQQAILLQALRLAEGEGTDTPEIPD